MAKGRKKKRMPVPLIIVLCVCVAALGVSIWQLSHIFLEYKAGTDEYDELQQYAVSYTHLFFILETGTMRQKIWISAAFAALLLLGILGSVLALRKQEADRVEIVQDGTCLLYTSRFV